MQQSFPSSLGTVLISDDPALLDVLMLHDYLSKSYWAKNIPLATLEKAIQHAICFGVYVNGKQVGFARAVTDRSTFAYLADVFIQESCRGNGLAKMLMECVHAHPELQGLRRWMLVTRDAHSLYRQFDWTDISFPERFLQKHDPAVYQRKED